MNQEQSTFSPQEYTMADQASRDERAAFISQTYLHLFGAIVAFAGLETLLLLSPFAESFSTLVFSTRYMWLGVLGAFMLVSYVADRWAQSAVSMGTQYAGLLLYVVASAVITVPLLYYVTTYDAAIIPTAGAVTLAIFGALTAVVFVTRFNFSFLRPFLAVAGIGAIGLIVCSIIFGFNLGIIFTIAMIVFACGYILYDTSQVLHTYRVGQHVAASLALFASVVLLFWYIVRLFAFSRD